MWGQVHSGTQVHAGRQVHAGTQVHAWRQVHAERQVHAGRRVHRSPAVPHGVWWVWLEGALAPPVVQESWWSVCSAAHACWCLCAISMVSLEAMGPHLEPSSLDPTGAGGRLK